MPALLSKLNMKTNWESRGNTTSDVIFYMQSDMHGGGQCLHFGEVQLIEPVNSLILGIFPGFPLCFHIKLA